MQRQTAAALPHPCLRGKAARRLQHGVAHLGKQMHMLVSVDIIRRPAEGRREGVELGFDLAGQSVHVETLLHGHAQGRPEREKSAVDRGRIAGRLRPQRPGQGDMKADRHAPSGTLKRGQHGRAFRHEARRDHHHRSCIEPPALD